MISICWLCPCSHSWGGCWPSLLPGHTAGLCSAAQQGPRKLLAPQPVPHREASFSGAMLAFLLIELVNTSKHLAKKENWDQHQEEEQNLLQYLGQRPNTTTQLYSRVRAAAAPTVPAPVTVPAPAASGKPKKGADSNSKACLRLSNGVETAISIGRVQQGAQRENNHLVSP